MGGMEVSSSTDSVIGGVGNSGRGQGVSCGWVKCFEGVPCQHRYHRRLQGLLSPSSILPPPLPSLPFYYL